jgi:hypothetical protein
MSWATFWTIFFTNSAGHPDQGPMLQYSKYVCQNICENFGIFDSKAKNKYHHIVIIKINSDPNIHPGTF